MSRSVLLLLLKLVLPGLIFAGATVLPQTIAHAGGGSGESGEGGEDGDSGDDGDDGESGEDGDDGDDGGPGNDGNDNHGKDDGDDDDKDEDDVDEAAGDDNSGKIGTFLNRILGGKPARSHQSSILRAVQDKKIMPLGDIRQIVKSKTQSEIIAIELSRIDRDWVYEFKIVDRRGRLREIYVDARTGRVLRSTDNLKQER